ncbi:hypothetical protein CPC08DRAFT_258812 [Agrocybe pediades]|nr:hypothetical protein CPC08DRAFT_258812 [Agrocybe pediades]
MLPRSSSDILASAQRAKRRSWTASQDPFASDPRFSTFFSTEVQEGVSLASNVAGGSTEVSPVSPTSHALPALLPYLRLCAGCDARYFLGRTNHSVARRTWV